MSDCACITNSAYIDAATTQASAITTNATWDVGIQVAAMIAQSSLSGRINDYQMDIANQQAQLAERVLAHAKEFWPHELDMIEDAFGEAKHTTDYAGVPNQWANIMQDTLNRSNDMWRMEAEALCRRATSCDEYRWRRFAQMNIVDVGTFGARVAEARVDILNDRRYSRQYAALALGKGIIAEVSTYQALAGATRLSNGQIIAESINSGMAAVGFYMSREKPVKWDRESTIGFGWSAQPRQSIQPMPVQPAPVAVASPVQLDSGIEVRNLQ